MAEWTANGFIADNSVIDDDRLFVSSWEWSGTAHAGFIAVWPLYSTASYIQADALTGGAAKISDRG